jgi:putative ABC transport system ATP-binding protein
MNFLQVENLSKAYQEGGQRRVVLHDTTLHIAKGKMVAIVGKSGSGKTTLLNLVSGIDLADSGDILFEGRSLAALNDLERTLFRRQNIGFIFQFFNLIPTLTVWENVTLPLELNGMMNDEGTKRAQELLALVGLSGREKSFPDRLSGGEQQRVAIARALAHNPLLLLADEPTGNLDEETGRQVMDLLARLVHSEGKTMILVTHSLEAAGTADQVFALHDGRLVEEVR